MTGERRKGFFEAGDFKVVLSHLPDYLRGPMEFAYLTGWRVRSEVLPLNCVPPLRRSTRARFLNTTGYLLTLR